jgi:alpha 1,2-mannosyltransferase
MKYTLKGKTKLFVILLCFLISLSIRYCFSLIVNQLRICEQQNIIQQRNLLIDIRILQPTETKIYTPCPTKVSNNDYYDPKTRPSLEHSINEIQQKWLSYVVSIEEYPLNKFKGRGIVTTVNNNIYPRLYASLRLLRMHKSQLPVEIFTFPDEMGQEKRKILEQIDHVQVRLMNTSESLRDRKLTRYAIKPHAIIQSTFADVLWMDADNIIIHSPDYLFDLPHYTRSSAIFWPDFLSSTNENPIWKILNLTCRAEDYEQESGQIVINKKLSWRALHLAKHLNGDKDVMKLILGDKDTFRLAWKALNIPFYFIRRYPALAGFYHRPMNDNTTTPRFCGHTMIQHDPFGKILFVHASLLKYIWKSQYSVEKKYPQFTNLSNPWRVLKQYANTAAYFRPQVFGVYGYRCKELPTGENEHYPPVVEGDFHSYISPNITMLYLRFLNENDKGVYSGTSSLVL